MPSTDLNGEYICILGERDVRGLLDILPPDTGVKAKRNAITKLKRFIKDVDRERAEREQQSGAGGPETPDGQTGVDLDPPD